MIAFFMMGCSGDNAYQEISNDSTKESKLEQSRILINDRKYDDAIDILERLNQNSPDVLRPLAGAYAGRTGYETLELLKAIPIYQNADNIGEVTLKIIAYIMLKTKEDITSDELDFALDNLTYSISLYEKYLVIDPDAKGVITQLGFVSLAHFSYLFVELLSLHQQEIGESGTVVFSEAGIDEMYNDAGLTFTFPPGYEEILDAMSEDLRRMADAVYVIASLFTDPDEIRDEISEFLKRVDNGQGSGSVPGDNIQTEEELIYYLEHIEE